MKLETFETIISKQDIHLYLSKKYIDNSDWNIIPIKASIEWEIEFELRSWGIKSYQIFVKNVNVELTIEDEEFNIIENKTITNNEFTVIEKIEKSNDSAVITVDNIEIDFENKKIFVYFLI